MPSIIVNPLTEDAYAHEGQPAIPHNGTHVMAGVLDKDEEDELDAYWKADLSALPAGAVPCYGCELHLYVDVPFYDQINFEFTEIDPTAWDEVTLTWLNAPAPGPFRGPLLGPAGVGWWIWDDDNVPIGVPRRLRLSQMLALCLATYGPIVSLPFYPVCLKDADHGFNFRSSEHATVGTRPYLIVEYCFPAARRPFGLIVP